MCTKGNTIKQETKTWRVTTVLENIHSSVSAYITLGIWTLSVIHTHTHTHTHTQM
jgi:hypothetical protein